MKLIFCVVLTAVALATIFLPFPAAYVRAQSTSPVILAFPQLVTFGIIGIAAGQTARLNALSLPTGGPIIAGGSCQVTMAFLDDKGDTLATHTQAVTQGQAVHFDLPTTPTSTTASAGPVEIRGTVSASFTVTGGTPTVSTFSCSVLPTMEIYNQDTGRTAAVLENSRSLATVLPLAVLR